MPVAPLIMDPIPLPKEDPNAVKPVEQREQSQPLPRDAGYVSKAGAGAFLADQVLKGWMAGRDQAVQRKVKAAREDVQGAQTAYDVISQQWKNYIDSGGDRNPGQKLQQYIAQHGGGENAKDLQNDPEFQKLKQGYQLQQGMVSTWDDYINTAKKYSGADQQEAAGGKKPGVGAKLKGALGNPQAQLFGHVSNYLGSLQGGPGMQYQPDLESQAAKQDLETGKLRQEQMRKQGQMTDEQIAENAEIKHLREARSAAIKSGDNKAIEQSDQQLAGLGVNIQEPIPGERELRQTNIQRQLGAWKKIDSGEVKSVHDLPETEQIAIGVPPVTNAFDAYQSQVGQGKRFKDSYQAARQYMADEGRAHSMGRAPSPWDEVMRSENIVLQHDLQDPATAKAYGLQQPLKPGERVPEWVLHAEALKRMKASPDERTQKANQYMAATRALDSFVSDPKGIAQTMADKSLGLSPEQQQAAAGTLFQQNPETGEWQMKPESMWGQSEKHTGWLGMGASEDTINGVPVSKLRTLQGNVVSQTRTRLEKMYKNAPPETLDAAMAALTGQPSPVSNPQQSGGGKRMRSVTVNGQTVQREMTDEQAEQLSSQGVTIQ